MPGDRGRQQLGGAAQEREPLADAEVVVGPDIEAAQVKHQVHLGGPSAEAADAGDLRDDLLVAEAVKLVELELPRGHVLAERPQVRDLLARQAAGAQALVVDGEKVAGRGRGAGGPERAEAAVDGGGGRAGQLLVDDGAHERGERALARVGGEAKGADARDEGPERGVSAAEADQGAAGQDDGVGHGGQDASTPGAGQVGGWPRWLRGRRGSGRVARLVKTVIVPVLAAMALTVAGCGRTEMEWDQKVREVEALSARVARQNQERAKLDEDGARLQEDNAALKAEVAARPPVRSIEAMCNEQQRDRQQSSEQLKQRADALRTRLESQASEGLTVSLRRGQLTVTLPGQVLFEGKNTELTPKGRQMLRTVAEAIVADQGLLARFFLVTAHEVPAKNEESAINRSQVRAAVVRDLMTSRQGGLPPARWSAAGRGVVDPVVGDDKPDQVSKNQRVELTVLADGT